MEVVSEQTCGLLLSPSLRLIPFLIRGDVRHWFMEKARSEGRRCDTSLFKEIHTYSLPTLREGGKLGVTATLASQANQGPEKPHTAWLH